MSHPNPPTHNPTTDPKGDTPFIFEHNGEVWYWDFSKAHWFVPEQDPLAELELETAQEQATIAQLAQRALAAQEAERKRQRSENLFVDSDDELYEAEQPHIPKRTPTPAQTAPKKRKFEQHNCKIYFTGVPEDASVAELEGFFSRAGIIKKDPLTGELFIKLFKTEEGKHKGDGTCTYFRAESVEQAISLLDGAQLRFGVVISVSEATYENKKKKKKKKKKTEEGAEGRKEDEFQSKKKKKQRLRYDQSKDLSWDEETRVHIILKHMFAPRDGWTDMNFVSNLKAEVKEECERFGKVETVSVFENNEEGVIALKFEDPIAAGMCLEKMNGRWFGGRRISAEYYDGYTNYHVAETEEQKKLRAEAWNKWLEEGNEDGNEEGNAEGKAEGEDA